MTFVLRKNSILLLSLFVIAFIFSYLFSPFHQLGDQAHYNKAYESVRGFNLSDAFIQYKEIIHTNEPIHFLIIWISGLFGISKLFVMSFFNGLLFILFYKFLKNKGATTVISLWILFSNYYLYTLFFTLERTKFGLIFMLLYLNFRNSLFLINSIMSHVSMLIPISLNAIGECFRLRRRPFALIASSSFVLLASSLVIYFIVNYLNIDLVTHIESKFFEYLYLNRYSDDFDWGGLFVLLVLSIVIGGDSRVKIVIFYLGLISLVFFIGSSRVNMIGFLGFLYFANLNDKFFKIIIIPIGFYFFLKTFFYLYGIYVYGG